MRRMPSLAQARALHLHAQGLLSAPPRRRATPADLDAAIARMQLLQIDTIHVVARSPYLVLFSRLGDYPMHWLEDALAEARIFECWAHEACFAPIADWPLHHANRAARDHHWGMRSARRQHAGARRQLDALLAHVRARGPVKAADFARTDGGGGAWWGWKDEKRWLEALFALGELGVARRERFQRVYDVIERVIPDHLRDAPPPWRAAGARPASPAAEAAALRRACLLRAARALGISQARWLADYHRLQRRATDAELAPLVAEGALLRAEVPGWDAPAYVHPDHADALALAEAGRLRATRTVVLSPFDPVVWDRARAAAMFGFDYRLECYVPAPKRRYGYFVLPLLHRGRLVGRLDAKAHRGEGVLEVLGLWFEPGEGEDAATRAAVLAAIEAFAAWQGLHGPLRWPARSRRGQVRLG